MRLQFVLLLLVVAAAAIEGSAQTTRFVPAGFSTIQGAIGASAAGDTVLVSPGTHVETLDFLGKNIEVRSTLGVRHTIIDASGLGARVVTFDGFETRAALLEGFTITGGRAPNAAGFSA